MEANQATEPLPAHNGACDFGGSRRVSRIRAGFTWLATAVALAAFLVPALAGGARAEANPATNPNPFERPGMWIWYLSAAEAGNFDRIISRARTAGVGTLYIKSADGTGTWSQFTKSMVSRFQGAGLKVCGWHYVYGTNPIGEAKASAYAKQQGADCFVIDAEAEYERNNQYAKADRYTRKLRGLVGKKFPLGLSSFPYTHYHRAFPYSVFMGPGGATANLPQVYWKTIGDTAKESLSITWIDNTLYNRRIYPLGQTYLNPSRRSVENFRRFLLSYGVAPSWWSWQHTGKRQWQGLNRKITSPFPGYSRERQFMVLRSGNSGDQVVWMQQHLLGAGYTLNRFGVFDTKTEETVIAFQKSRGLPADGVVGNRTWRELLKVKPVRILWGKAGSGRSDLRSGVSTASAPLSANIPPVRNELAGKPGR